MKVWERIRAEMVQEGIENINTKEQVRDWMYHNRCTPCEIEENFEILSEPQISLLCTKHEDCQSCLDDYLESEVEHNG